MRIQKNSNYSNIITILYNLEDHALPWFNISSSDEIWPGIKISLQLLEAHLLIQICLHSCVSLAFCVCVQPHLNYFQAPCVCFLRFLRLWQLLVLWLNVPGWLQEVLFAGPPVRAETAYNMFISSIWTLQWLRDFFCSQRLLLLPPQLPLPDLVPALL